MNLSAQKQGKRHTILKQTRLDWKSLTVQMLLVLVSGLTWLGSASVIVLQMLLPSAALDATLTLSGQV